MPPSSSSLTQPRRTDSVRAPSHPIPKLPQDLRALCLPGSLRMNCVGSRKSGFFLTNHLVPGNHQVHVSGGVGMGWDTAQGAAESFSPWIRARSSWFVTGWGRAVGQSWSRWFVPLQPWPAQSRSHPALQGGSQTIPGPVPQLLDPSWPLCADEMLFFKLKNWSPYK